MKFFNIENAPKGEPSKKAESIVIGTWEEWREVMDAIDEYARAHPRKSKIKQIKKQFDDFLCVF